MGSLARGRAKIPAYMSPVLSPAQRTVPTADTSKPTSSRPPSGPSKVPTEKQVQSAAGRGRFPDDWKKDIVHAIRGAMKEAAKEVLAKHLEKSGYPFKRQSEKVGAEEDNKKDKGKDEKKKNSQRK